MSSLSINLDQDENILIIAKKHWFYLFWPLAATIFIGVFTFFLPALWLIYRILRYYYDEIIVTNKKVYIKTGILTKSTMSTPLDKIHNIHINKSIIGRMLDYGTIFIQSGATLGTSGYSCIRSPEQVQNYMEYKA